MNIVIELNGKKYSGNVEEVGGVINPPQPPIIIPIPQPTVITPTVTGYQIKDVRLDTSKNELVLGLRKDGNMIDKISFDQGNTYHPFGGVIIQPANTTQKYYFSKGGEKAIVEIKVGSNTNDISINGVNFNVTDSTQVTNPPVVDSTPVSTTPPVVVSSEGSFSLNTPQLNIAPLNQRIKLSKKIQFQTSSWSCGFSDYGSSGMKLQISRGGRTIYNLDIPENSYPKEINNPANLSVHPDDLKNNHPNSTRLILPEGTYKIEYQNSSATHDYPIVFSLLDTRDANYFVYYPCGLKHNKTVFFKQLNKGESLTTNFTLFDNVGEVRQQGDNLHRGVFINFIVNGKISLERFEVDFGNGQFQTCDYLRPVSAINDSKLKFVMERDHSKFIELAFYPNSNEFMVLAKNGVDVAEEHVDLTTSVFQLINYGSNGVKFPNFKMTNNAGYDMSKEFGSIMQKNKNGELVENGAEDVVVPLINGVYKTTQPWRYNC